jgi:hypothetical protein
VPIISVILQTKKTSVWVIIDNDYMVKRMNVGRMESLVKLQGQESMITKTQGVCLVRVRDTPIVLSHNEWTRDEHGNA